MRTALTLTFIVILAAILRLINANAEFWFDEISSAIAFVGRPLPEIVTVYRLAGNHVLYSILVNIAVSLLGTEPWAQRLPAIVFGVGGVSAFWFVAGRVWPRLPALAGTLLFAVSYPHIYYSQNARGYSAFMFFALIATGLIVRLLDRDRDDRRHRWLGVAYSVTLALGLYAMVLMVFVIAGHAAVLAALRRWRLLAWTTAGAVLGALLYAPMALSMFEFYRADRESTGYPLLSATFLRMLAPILPALVAATVVMLPIVVRFVRRRPAIAALLLAPAVLNVLVPLVRGQGVYPRGFLYGLCLAYLLLVEGLDWVFARRPKLAWLLTAAAVIASTFPLVRFYQLPKQGFRQAIAYVDRHAQPSDQRAGLSYGGKAIRYYDSRFVLVQNVQQLEALTTRADRPLWVIVTFPTDLRTTAPPLYEWLRDRTSRRAEFPGVIGDGTVYVHYWPGP